MQGNKCWEGLAKRAAGLHRDGEETGNNWRTVAMQNLVDTETARELDVSSRMYAKMQGATHEQIEAAIELQEAEVHEFFNQQH